MDNKNELDKKFEEAWNSLYAAVPEEEVNKSWDKFRAQIKSPKRKHSNKKIWNISIVAATLLLVCTSYFYLEFHNPTITEENLSSVEKEVTLPDGSLVILQQGAHLKYKKYFKKNREVELVGTAFFDVVKDSLKKFTVGTGTSTIRVLGTSFSVSSEKKDKMEVALYTGRVSVSIEGAAESWGLIPGEKFLLNQGKAYVENFDLKPSFQAGGQFIDIDKMKTNELLSFLENRFNYRFIPSSFASNKWVTLRINKDDSLEDILDLLSAINNITYEINKENRIVILTEE